MEEVGRSIGEWLDNEGAQGFLEQLGHILRTHLSSLITHLWSKLDDEGAQGFLE